MLTEDHFETLCEDMAHHGSDHRPLVRLGNPLAFRSSPTGQRWSSPPEALPC